MRIDLHYLSCTKNSVAIRSVLLALHKHREQLPKCDDFLHEYHLYCLLFCSALHHEGLHSLQEAYLKRTYHFTSGVRQTKIYETPKSSSQSKENAVRSFRIIIFYHFEVFHVRSRCITICNDIPAFFIETLFPIGSKGSKTIDSVHGACHAGFTSYIFAEFSS